MRIVVLDSFAADQGDSDWPDLRALGDVTLFPRAPTDNQRLVEACQGAEALITNKEPVTAALIGSLPALRYIGVSATGTNIVAVEAARARGIAVTNVPGYSTESVAQLVFALILELGLDVARHSRAVKEGHWARTPDFCFFLRPLPELAGKTLVIIGQGAIGSAVARIGAAFGMTVIAAASPGRSTPGRMPLHEALPLGDVVTLHCPLTADTAAMVNESFLRLLRPTALLINTSRGGLVDEADLVRALAAGQLAGVGLDVLGTEPPGPDHPLTDPRAPWAARVVVTPHIGWGTVEARARLRGQVADNLRAFVAGKILNRIV